MSQNPRQRADPAYGLLRFSVLLAGPSRCFRRCLMLSVGGPAGALRVLLTGEPARLLLGGGFYRSVGPRGLSVRCAGPESLLFARDPDRGTRRAFVAALVGAGPKRLLVGRFGDELSDAIVRPVHGFTEERLLPDGLERLVSELLSTFRAFLREVPTVLFAIDLCSHRDRKTAVAVFTLGALRGVLALALVTGFGRVVPIAIRPYCIPAVLTGFVVPLSLSGRFTTLAETGLFVPVFTDVDGGAAFLAGLVVPLGFSGRFTVLAEPRLVVPVSANVDGSAAILARPVVPFGIIGFFALFAEPWRIPFFEDVDLMSAFRGVGRLPLAHRCTRPSLLYSIPRTEPIAVEAAGLINGYPICLLYTSRCV